MCWHHWVDPSNKVVRAGGWKLCVKCGKLKPPRKRWFDTGA